MLAAPCVAVGKGAVPVGAEVGVVAVFVGGIGVPVRVTVGVPPVSQIRRMMSVSEVYGKAALSEKPTAHISPGEAAVTPYRRLKSRKPFGLVSIVHWVPSQRIIKVSNPQKLQGALVPTAHTSLADTACTSRRML